GSRDGGVHALFVISGRVDATGDATGCTIVQDDFEGNASRGNAIFRIPTPTFGAGLIEMIPDYVIVANQRAGLTLKSSPGLPGPRPPSVSSRIHKFAFFMTFLAPPTPSPDTPGGSASIARGRLLFAITGCALCHTPSLTTGPSVTPAFDRQPVNLFSDVLLHN